MKNKKNIINFAIIILISILLIVFLTGCEDVNSITPSVIPESNLVPISTGPFSGLIIIENGAEFTKDCTPNLAIFSEGAAYMSFSGDGQTWTDWIEYNTSYDEFNIANGLFGTKFGSGTKYVYVRFKDKEDNLSPSDEYAFDSIEYEMGELFSIKIFPQEVTIPVGGSCLFSLHGYDYGSKNEVPLDGSKVVWTKCCGVGNLSPTVGLSTIYIAPFIPGERNITAQYNNLKTGAKIIIVKDNQT